MFQFYGFSVVFLEFFMCYAGEHIKDPCSR